MSDTSPTPLRAPDHRPRLFREVIGDLLRQVRQDQGRTLRDVAGHAQVSVPYLSEVERGRKEASSEVLSALCRSLGIEMGDLIVSTGRQLMAASAPLDLTSRRGGMTASRVVSAWHPSSRDGSAFALAA